MVAEIKQCPEEKRIQSVHKGGQVCSTIGFTDFLDYPLFQEAAAYFKNNAGYDLTMWWVDFEGDEHYRGVVGDGDDSPMNSFPGICVEHAGTLGTHTIHASAYIHIYT